MVNHHPLLIYSLYVTLGASTLITVHQPPVLIRTLGTDIILPCHLSSDDMLSPPILYWVYQDTIKLWPPSDKFKNRVDRVDQNEESLNKSIVFKNVQWMDSGNYLCKLSILTTESEKRYRIRGNETQLIIYGRQSCWVCSNEGVKAKIWIRYCGGCRKQDASPF